MLAEQARTVCRRGILKVEDKQTGARGIEIATKDWKEERNEKRLMPQN